MFGRKKRPALPPPLEPVHAVLDFDQRQRVSMALARFAEEMRAIVHGVDAGTAPPGMDMSAHRDKLVADADDTERLASKFRVARDVELRFERSSVFVSDERSRQRELEAVVELWSTAGVPPHAVAAALFDAGVRLYSSLGTTRDDLAERMLGVRPSCAVVARER